MSINKPASLPYIKEDRAAYRILAERGFYGDDDTLYAQDSEIYWDGEPNEEMEPLNALAVERLKRHLEKLDRLAAEVAEKTGKAYTGRPRNIDGGLDMATAVQRAEMSIFGKARDDSRIEKIEKDPVAETGNVNPNKRGRGRPRKASLLVDSAA